MCFFGFNTLKVLTLILAAIITLCNAIDISISVTIVAETEKGVRYALVASIVMDTLVNFGILNGIYGTVNNNTTKVKRFILVLLIFFFGKIAIAKSVAEFNDEDIELVISIWYELDVVFTGIGLICAVPFCLKLLEKESRAEILV